MAKYIEREAAKLRIFEYGVRHRNNSSISSACENLERQMNSIPAADVRPVVRGRWEKGTSENGVTTALFCSCCHYENRHWYEWSYCPNCGADMREEQDGR